MRADLANPDAPNCWQCQQFYITHKPARPYGCRLMGFESRHLPCLVVLRNDGHPCLGFTPKPSVSDLRHEE